MSIVNTVKYVMPYGLVQQVFRSKAAKRRRIVKAQARLAQSGKPYSYAAAIDFHCSRGLPRGHVEAGSMPEASLVFCCAALDKFVQIDGPLVGLHVGNFLGVSLAHFANYVRGRNSKSIVQSIDPDITHRGIAHPQQHVIASLNHFGLHRNALISVGYSVGKSISNDGEFFVGDDGEYDPYSKFDEELACEETLTNLGILSPGRFDFAVIDGNHEGNHLRREADLVGLLLRPGGLLILDDVSEAWAEIKAAFDGLQTIGWDVVGADGRVGILHRG